MKSETPKTFKLDGKPLSLATPPPQCAVSIMKFLDPQPDDQLFTREELAKAVGSTTAGVQNYSTIYSSFLAPYRTNVPSLHGKQVWGSKRAIAALKRELGVE